MLMFVCGHAGCSFCSAHSSTISSSLHTNIIKEASPVYLNLTLPISLTLIDLSSKVSALVFYGSKEYSQCYNS